jgi:ribosomal protein S18 acetylase RimI-like enzyme
MPVRAYRATDRESVIAIWNRVFPDSTGHNDPEASIDRKVAQRDSLFFVAVDEETIIGTVLSGYDGHRGWIYSLAVAPDRQRSGAGTQLVRHVESALAALGCPKVNLQVRADNAAVVAFYESLGYQTEERISLGRLLE